MNLKLAFIKVKFSEAHSNASESTSTTAKMLENQEFDLELSKRMGLFQSHK